MYINRSSANKKRVQFSNNQNTLLVCPLSTTEGYQISTRSSEFRVVQAVLFWFWWKLGK